MALSLAVAKMTGKPSKGSRGGPNGSKKKKGSKPKRRAR